MQSSLDTASQTKYSNKDIVPPSQRKRKSPEYDAKECVLELKNEITDFKRDICSMFTDIKEQLLSLRNDNTLLSSSIAELKVQHNKVLQEISDMQKSIQYVMDDQKGTEKSVNDLSLKVKMPERNTIDHNNLNIKLDKLLCDQNKQQQIARLTNLELSGIPEMKNEHLINIAMSIAKHAGVELKDCDIDHANRVQPMKSISGRPRSIIVKLKKRSHKDAIIAGLRKTRGITTQDINIPGDSRRIFVSEHLTPESKQLYKACRQLAQDKGYMYTWIKNCRIFVRKIDGSPLIRIETEKDLAKLV